MADDQVTLEQAIELARGLDPTERLKLRQALDQMIAGPTERNPEMAFKRRLLEKGLISEIRLAPKDDNLSVKRQPVPVEGKPVSETIIEDRR